MAEIDAFILREVEQLLEEEEQVLYTGVLTQGMVRHMVRFYFAAITSKRLILIQAKMGLTTLLRENHGGVEIRYSAIKNYKLKRNLADSELRFILLNGQSNRFRWVSYAGHGVTGHKDFKEGARRIETLIGSQ